MSTERWEAVKRRIADLGRAHVRAGVVGPAAHEQHGDSGLTNGEIAIVHELGTRDVPARPFVGKTMEDPAYQSQAAALIEKATRAVVDGKMSRDAALNVIGTHAAAAIRRTVTEGDLAPPLAPATVEAKGSSKPLVETGQLVGAISWEVMK